MKFLVLSLGKILFQISIVVFIVGYCFGFWFKDKKKTAPKIRSKPSQPFATPSLNAHKANVEAA